MVLLRRLPGRCGSAAKWNVQLKRKAERWRKKYTQLSQQERMAIMAELSKVDFKEMYRGRF